MHPLIRVVVGLFLPFCSLSWALPPKAQCVLAAVLAANEANQVRIAPHRANPTGFQAATGLWGVSSAQRDSLLALIVQHLGVDPVEGVYAIGSRAVGRASVLKGGRAVTDTSDLDVVVVINGAALKYCG